MFRSQNGMRTNLKSPNGAVMAVFSMSSRSFFFSQETFAGNFTLSAMKPMVVRLSEMDFSSARICKVIRVYKESWSSIWAQNASILSCLSNGKFWYKPRCKSYTQIVYISEKEPWILQQFNFCYFNQCFTDDPKSCQSELDCRKIWLKLSRTSRKFKNSDKSGFICDEQKWFWFK